METAKELEMQVGSRVRLLPGLQSSTSPTRNNLPYLTVTAMTTKNGEQTFEYEEDTSNPKKTILRKHYMVLNSEEDWHALSTPEKQAFLKKIASIMYHDSSTFIAIKQIITKEVEKKENGSEEKQPA